MNEDERYLLDLNGYVVFRNAIPADALARMNAWIDGQAEQDPRWLGQPGNDKLEDLLTWTDDFRNLMDSPTILPSLAEMLGDDLRLDHEYAIFLQPGGEGLSLHGGATPYDREQYYHCVNGRIYCGLTTAVWALTDVAEGAGGFASVPGSHKSNYEVPASMRSLDGSSSIVVQTPVKAGDCIVFTEALLHGTLPWKGPGARRSLFFKYSPGSLSWSNHVYDPAPVQWDRMSEIAGHLTERQRALLQAPGHFRRRPVIKP